MTAPAKPVPNTRCYSTTNRRNSLSSPWRRGPILRTERAVANWDPKGLRKGQGK